MDETCRRVGEGGGQTTGRERRRADVADLPLPHEVGERAVDVELRIEVRDRSNRRIRVEHYHDLNPKNPTAYHRMLTRMDSFVEENWRTLVIDSTTFLELAARKWAQYGVDSSCRGCPDPRKFYGVSKDLLEEFLLLRVSGLRCNVVTCCHIDEEKDEVNEEMLRNPALPGKLSKRAPSAYGELYRAYVTRDESGQRVYLIQTRADNLYNASTQIEAPDPCHANYASLWAEYDKAEASS